MVKYMTINSELTNRIKKLEIVNGELLSNLINEIESQKNKEDIKITLRNKIRENVIKEMKI